jgi:hypothetical protein
MSILRNARHAAGNSIQPERVAAGAAALRESLQSGDVSVHPPHDQIVACL